MRRALRAALILLALSLPALAIVGGSILEGGNGWGWLLVAPLLLALTVGIVAICWAVAGEGGTDE